MRSSSTTARGPLYTLLATVIALLALSTTHAFAQNSGGSGDAAASDAAKDDKPADSGASNPADPATPADGATTGTPADGATGTPAGGATGTTAGTSGDAGTPAVATTPTKTSDMPVNLRLRRLEQRVQALKERAWRAKARVGMLKEAVLGGGVGATATIMHKNKMGGSFRLIKLVYALDGTQIFARADDTGSLHKQKDFEVLTGPIAPGSHTISVLAIYRGHGYGVFKYLTKYKFTVRSSHTFTASEGKATRIEAKGYEKGGPTTPLEDRPALDFKVSHSKGSIGN